MPRKSNTPKKTAAKHAKKKVEISNKVPLYEGTGKENGAVMLDEKMFNGNVNTAVLHAASLMYQANKRVGLASTKQRDEVSGGNKKPWRQKGTGRARSGSTRNPLWRGGGKIFGPHPRDFSYQLPKAVKRVALLSSLNAKLKDQKFSVIKDVKLDSPKTKKFAIILDAMKKEGSVLFVVSEMERNLTLATRNIPYLTVVHYTNINAYEVLRHVNFVITEGALTQLSARLKA